MVCSSYQASFGVVYGLLFFFKLLSVPLFPFPPPPLPPQVLSSKEANLCGADTLSFLEHIGLAAVPGLTNLHAPCRPMLSEGTDF